MSARETKIIVTEAMLTNVRAGAPKRAIRVIVFAFNIVATLNQITPTATNMLATTIATPATIIDAY